MDEISIYNSRLRKTKVHPHVTKQIASLFAIATATSLCYGIPPSTVLFDQNQMRKHLVRCYESGKMVPFWARDLPQQQHFIKEFGDELVLTTVNTRIYCSCRMPQLGKDKMAQCTLCKEWFTTTFCL